MRRILMLITVVAVMAALVAASAAMTLAKPKETFTVKCEGFRIGPGEGEPFTQELPIQAVKGSTKSIERADQPTDDQCKQIF